MTLRREILATTILFACWLDLQEFYRKLGFYDAKKYKLASTMLYAVQHKVWRQALQTDPIGSGGANGNYVAQQRLHPRHHGLFSGLAPRGSSPPCGALWGHTGLGPRKLDETSRGP